MKRLRLFLVVLLTLSGQHLFAQQGAVKGIITDDYNNFVEGAKISLSGNSLQSVTDEKGVFEIKDVPFGKYTLSISEENHETFNQEIEVKELNTDIGFLTIIVNGSVAEDDRADIPSVSLTDADVKESAAPTVSGILSASRDAFNAATSYTFSAARFKVRGYDNDNFVTYVNGVPVTDLNNGNTMYYLWSGLNDVTRNKESTSNLAPGSYAFGGIGGSNSIDTRATRQRKQLSVAYSLSNRAYSNRVMATYGTGLLKGGWAFAGSLSRRWSQEGYIPGSYYDGWSYFLSAEKVLNYNHSISLTAFGTPTERGRSAPATKEMYDLAGTNYYNPTWGYQNGEIRNASIGISHQPVAILSHDWKISSQTQLRTSVGYTFGENIRTALDWYNAPDPRPDFYRKLPSYYDEFPEVAAQLDALLRNNEELRQIQWDQLYNTNANSFETINDANGIIGNSVSGLRSHYIVEERVTDSKKLHFNSYLNTNVNENFQLTAGITYMKQTTDNFKRVRDLLGGDFYVDINQYAEQDFADSANAIQNDVNNPNRILKEGDKFGYNYTSSISKGSGWIQGQWKFDKIDLFAAIELSQTDFKRTGNVKNGLFQENSFGDSETQSFFNYGVKGGATYKINGRNYIFLNGAKLTRAPYFENAFVSARTRNEFVPGLTDEQILSFEGGYLVKAPKLKVRAVGYFTQFDDQTKTVSFYHSDYRNFVNYSVTNIDERHLGLELALEYNLGKGFTASAVAAIGQYYYTDRPSATVTIDNTSEVLANETVYAENFYVGGTPQTAYTIGLGYRAKRFWFMYLNFNYYDNTYIDFNPARRTSAAIDLVPENSDQWNSIVNQEKTSSQLTVDFFGGKSWKLNNYFKTMKHNTFLVLNVGVSNLTNNKDLVTGGFEQLRYDFADKDPSSFAPKYFYSFGTTYFVNLILRIN